MATNRDVNINIKTKADVKGVKDVSKELDKLSKAAKTAEKAEKELRLEADKARKSDEKLANALDKEADKLALVAKEAKKAAKAHKEFSATSTKVDKGQKKVAKSTQHTGLAFLEVSRAVEDAQFGLRGVLNNIPQIITLFGGSAGLAAAVSIAAVTLAQFVNTGPQTKKLKADFQGLDTVFKQNAQSIKDGTEALEEYEEQIENISTALDVQADKVKLLATLDLERAKNAARIANNAIELERLDIIGDEGLTERQKSNQLSSLTQKQIKAGGELETQAAETKIESLLVDLNKGFDSLEDAQNNLNVLLDPSNETMLASRGAEDLRRVAEDQNREFRRVAEAAIEKMEDATGFFGSLSSDSIEDPIAELNKRFDKLSDDDKADTDVAAGFLRSFKEIIEPLSLGSGTAGAEALQLINDALGQKRGIAIASGDARRATEAEKLFKAQLEAARESVKRAKEESKTGAGQLRPQIAFERERLSIISKETEQKILIEQKKSANKDVQLREKERKASEAANKRVVALRESTAAGARTSARGGETLASGLERAGKEGLIAPSLRGKAKSTTAGLRKDGATSGEAEGSVSVLRDVREALRGTNKASQAQLKLVNDLIGIAQKTADQLRVSERLIKKQQKEVDALKKNAKRSQN